MENSYLKELSTVDPLERITVLCTRLSKPIIELWHGITKGTLPWGRTLGACLFLGIAPLFPSGFEDYRKDSLSLALSEEHVALPSLLFHIHQLAPSGAGAVFRP